MRIEKIIPSTRTGGKLRVVFADGSTLAVLPLIAAEFSLCAGNEIDDVQLAALRQRAAELSARNRAVRIISTTGVTKRDLERRLVQKGESADDAKAAVEWLDELDLLDDAEIARQTVARGVAKGYGEGRIRQMLYEKRVPKQYWDEALAAMPEMDDALDSFLQKKLRGSTDRQDIQKAAQAAARRGHTWPDIKKALARYSEQAALEEDELTIDS